MNKVSALKAVAQFPLPKLSPAELQAWRRWRPTDTVRDVLVMRNRSGKYPLIQGGVGSTQSA